MLERGATEAEMAAFLVTELSDHFGLTPDPEREARFAGTVVQWYRENWAAAAT
jgi:hypothetical protein